MRTKNQQGEKESEKNAEAYLTSNSKQEKLANRPNQLSSWAGILGIAMPYGLLID